VVNIDEVGGGGQPGIKLRGYGPGLMAGQRTPYAICAPYSSGHAEEHTYSTASRFTSPHDDDDDDDDDDALVF
jgi:hypothetical protein